MQETYETQVQALGWEDPLEGGHGNPLQYSCLENPTESGAWFPAHSEQLFDKPWK